MQTLELFCSVLEKKEMGCADLARENDEVTFVFSSPQDAESAPQAIIAFQ